MALLDFLEDICFNCVELLMEMVLLKLRPLAHRHEMVIQELF